MRSATGSRRRAARGRDVQDQLAPRADRAAAVQLGRRDGPLAGESRPDDFVFLNRRGRPWTNNAVRCRMRRLPTKLKLKPDVNGENVVAYTFRHTAATRACTSDVTDRVLADLMGHTSTDTTRRYQHPQLDHLSEAIQQMNAHKAQ